MRTRVQLSSICSCNLFLIIFYAQEGVAGAFELLFTVNERVHTGQWVGECFLYTNGNRYCR